jgi:hypothetical protein
MTAGRNAGRWLGLASLEGRVLVLCAANVDGTGADAFRFGTWPSNGTGERFIARRVKP